MSAGISKQAAQKEQTKEGLQPLTSENLKDFLIEDESWEDPKDFGNSSTILSSTNPVLQYCSCSHLSCLLINPCCFNHILFHTHVS
jgi:hypothetical protein